MSATLYDRTFRPRSEPFRTLYDAFQAEASKRQGRALDVWAQAELEAVHQAAVQSFPQYGLPCPTRAQVAAAEIYARGAIDYGAQWAYSLVNDICRLNGISFRGKPL